MANVRFASNNIGASDATTVTASTATTAGPITQAFINDRQSYWQTTGESFPIDDTNNQLHYNDGVNTTIYIANDTYTSGAALAAEIEASLNNTSSGWTVTYSSNTFTISHATATIRLSDRTNAVWDTLGFLGTLDALVSVTGVTRYHWFDYVHFDLGTAHDITFCALLHPSDTSWPVSASGTVTLEGNNIDAWGSPAVTKTLEAGQFGAFGFLGDDGSTNSYRYWRIKISDPTNPGNADSIKIEHIYLGDYFEPSSGNISSQFNELYVDQSSVVQSLSGVKYFNSRPKYRSYQGLNLKYLTGSDYEDFRQLTYDVGLSEPFWMILDPLKECFSTIGEHAVYCRFSQNPIRQHVKTNTYAFLFAIDEVL